MTSSILGIRLGKTMTVLLCVALFSACSKTSPDDIPADVEKTSRTTAETEESIDTEVSISSEQIQQEYAFDTRSQIRLISGQYEYLKKDFFSEYLFEDEFDEDYVFPSSWFAVTDLDQNGRLEVIISTCQGSGAFSNTVFYEISEDYTGLERLAVNGQMKSDDAGDFISFYDFDTGIALYDCFQKGDQLYFLIRDYASGGWSNKYLGYYSYSIGTEVKRDFIGGVNLSVDTVDDKEVVKTWLFDTDNNLFGSEASYMEYMNSYWSGYVRQDPLRIKWMSFSDDTDFFEKVLKSYSAFGFDTEVKTVISYDYRDYFRGLYEDKYEYVIQDT